MKSKRPAKPRELKIEGRFTADGGFDPHNKKPWLAIFVAKNVELKDVRRLRDWLQKYIDWQEAQASD